MDVNVRLFSERLKRMLAGEEGMLTLPDSTDLKTLFKNILTETENITTLLCNYEGDMAWLLIRLWVEADVDRRDILEILKDINYFVHESEKAIDTLFITIMQPQQNSESSTCKELYDALFGLQRKIINIGNRMKEIPPSDNEFGIKAARDFLIQAGYSSRSEELFDLLIEGHTQLSVVDNDISELERGTGELFDLWIEGQPQLSVVVNVRNLEKGREDLLDLLIEGQPRLSVVAILDSSGFDKTAFAAETFNNNHVKFYFDCHAWVRVSPFYDSKRMLDDIMKFVMPACEIIGKDYESKKTILHDYLTNKKYFIVLDDVWCNNIWDDLGEVLPDYQNGSRVLITVADPDILTSFELENGDQIQGDSVLLGGPLIRIPNQDWHFYILHYGSKSLENHMSKRLTQPFCSKIVSMLELRFFNLRVCCLYLCIFPPSIEISTRQLHQLWIAEGLIQHNSQETAKEYLNELIGRGFIHVTKRSAGGTIKACYVPTYVCAILIRIAEWTNFAKLIIRRQEERSWKTTKRFTILKNLTPFVSFEHSDTYLHSLLKLTSESDRLALIDFEKICRRFKLLRVLNLSSLVLDHCTSGIENLFYLRYLKLNIPSLKSLPSSICILLNLQTLDMPSSYIDHTPEDIWKMHKLIHLNFGCISLPEPPKYYCSSLENLIFISALHPSSCTPDILGRLPNVQTLRIYGDLSYYQSQCSKNLCELLKLECLKLVNKSKVWQLSQMLLSEYQFPPSLTQLSLTNTELMEDPMPTLEKLPHLQVLKLKQNSYSGRKLACVDSVGFPQLKVLHLKSMLWLEEWTMGAGAMPKLQSLIVNPCAYLRKLPERLWCIKSLCKLELHWPQPELRQRLWIFEDMEWRYDIQILPYGI